MYLLAGKDKQKGHQHQDHSDAGLRRWRDCVGKPGAGAVSTDLHSTLATDCLTTRQGTHCMTSAMAKASVSKPMARPSGVEMPGELMYI